MEKEVVDKMYEEWIDAKFAHIFERYKRMVKELYKIDEATLCSKKKHTLTLRFVRTIYVHSCINKGVPYMIVSKSLNRTSNTTLHNVKTYADMYKTDQYFKYLADMALLWDEKH